MAKLILGKAPKTISKELTFPMLDGTTGAIKVDFIYRTRTAFAAWMDGMIDAIRTASEADLAAAKEKAATQAEGSIDLGLSESVLIAKKSHSQTDFLLGAVDGWNLDIPFDRAAVEQLIDEVPQAAATIISAYREAMTEGRLGN